ncbi:MAG TPA: alpha-E domain-containing protein, partial [Polyangia bacterium]|nr:alpha-E domain-containing protein [Polyangia bacterium]
PVEEEGAARDRFGEIGALIFDGETQGTLADTLRSVYRVARAIRDRLSSDTWRVITALDQELRDAETWSGAVSTTGAVSALLDRTVALLAGLSGLVMDSMSRGHGWRFLDMGRRLERAVSLTLTIAATLTSAQPSETLVLESLLEAADSTITYRRRYLASLHAAAVLDLLLTDPTNPRSVVFQLGALLEHVVKLPHLPGRARDGIESAIAQGADTLLSRLEEVSVQRLADVDADARRPALVAMMTELERELPALSDALTESYLNHATQARQLARLQWREAAP